MMRAFLAFLIVSTSLLADDKKGLPVGHPATKRWEQAKETYSGSVDTHKKALLRLISSTEERARTAGNAEAVKTIVAEKEAFEKRGVLPLSVKTTTYEKDLLVAKSLLQRDATTAKSVFLKAKMDSAAELIDAELSALVLEKTQPKELVEEKPSKTKPDPDDPRKEWSSTKSNRWVYTREGLWQEFGGGDTDRYWDEQSRDAKMIELKFRGADSWIRLYVDHADVRYNRNGKFAEWGRGEWVK